MLRTARALGLILVSALFLVRCGDSEPTAPPGPVHLVFMIQPSITEGNQPIVPAVQVSIQDRLGDTVTTATDAVTVAIGTNPGDGTLLGTTTITAVGGVARFPDLGIDRPGSGYTLVARSGNLAETESSAFDIVLSFVSISAGGFHTCGVTEARHAYCWGVNAGSFGDGTIENSQTPVLVSGGHSFASLSLGYIYTCGITTTGEAYCWGLNNCGQLGDGTDEQFRYVPTQVFGDLRFTSLSAGYNHTCALSTGGDAYCWGDNRSGWLGTGVSGDVHTPELVTGGLAFASVSAGGFHTCGITTGEAAHCWGANYIGQLGDSTTIEQSPVPVAGGLVLTSISCGFDHTCGITSDGEAYCWGANHFGQLGNGTPTPSLSTPVYTPVPVAGDLAFASISLGGESERGHTCGLTTRGEAYCWGWNAGGQLGDGTNSDRYTPTPVSGGLVFASLSLGRGHTCGVTTDGEAYCWGLNQSGQLGDGTTNHSSVPVRVVQ